MSMISPHRLSEVFVDVADTLVDDFDLIEFLSLVSTHTSELVDAQAVGVLLAGVDGRLQLMAASDERAEMLEVFQLQAFEGPCQDCFRTGGPVVNTDLEQGAGRWPRFAPRAVAAGFRSVHAFPLRLRSQVIGALNLFGTAAVAMTPEDIRVVQALADVATIGLLQERAIRQSELVTEQLQAALNSRIVIEQAKGALAQVHGGTPDEAFDRLRDYCRSRQRKLSEVAALVLTDPGSVGALTTPDA